MKKLPRIYTCTVFILIACFLFLLSGCGGEKPDAAATPAPSQSVSDPTPPSPAATPDDSAASNGNGSAMHAPTPPEGDPVHVSSAEELLEAIAPNTAIVVEPGYYNLSEFLEDTWLYESEQWNAGHPHVQLRACHDGAEAVICRVDGLSIRGDAVQLTEIVVEPRYAQVLNFEECSYISLSNLTMGHTETGDCSGNVLDFNSCRNIQLNQMDLYGCGVYGIACHSGTGELYAYDSTIRDCAFGALDIHDGNGHFEFHNCKLTGSDAFDNYEHSPHSELAFYACEFGDNETSYYMFLEEIYTEDCIWSENYTYPEYGYDVPVVFEPETMENVFVDKAFLDETYWYGYAMVNPESGETVMLPYAEDDGTYLHVNMDLYGDGTGWIETADMFEDFTWTVDEDSLVTITLADGRNYYLSSYTMGGESYVWLLLELEECMVWLY